MTDYHKYMVSQVPTETELVIPVLCSQCVSYDKSPLCQEHNAHNDTILIKVRSLPWSLMRQKLSLAMAFSDDGQYHYDVDTYNRECLKYMIVEAPWGKTDDVFLSQIDVNLGSALELLVPRPSSSPATAVSPDIIKKG